MKLRAFEPVSATLLALVLLAGATGCSTSRSPVQSAKTSVNRVPTYALAVAVRGGVEPTPAQWNAMYEKFYQALAARGKLLINDYTRADHIINVDFLPDPINPNAGTALVSSITANTYGRTAAVGSTAFNASYSSFGNPGFNPLWGLSSAYDRYGSYYNDYDYPGSSYRNTTPPAANPGTPTPVPPVTPVTPPHHQRPTNPADCPPGTYLPPPSYVGNNPRYHGPRDGSHTPPSSYSPAPRPEPSSSDRSYSGRSYNSSSDSSSSAVASAAPAERASWWSRVQSALSDSSHSSSDRTWSGRSHGSSDNGSSRSYSSSSSDSSSYSSSSSSSSSYSAPSYSAPSYSPPAESSSSSSGSSYTSGRDSGVNAQPN